MGITVSRPPTEDRGRAVLQWRTIDGRLPFLAIAKQTVTSRGTPLPGAAIARPHACIRSDKCRSGTMMQSTHRRRLSEAAGPLYHSAPMGHVTSTDCRHPGSWGRSPGTPADLRCRTVTVPGGARHPRATRPCLAKRQSAIISMRARATISLLRTFLSVPARARYHVTSAHSGWCTNTHARQRTGRRFIPAITGNSPQARYLLPRTSVHATMESSVACKMAWLANCAKDRDD